MNRPCLLQFVSTNGGNNCTSDGKTSREPTVSASYFSSNSTNKLDSSASASSIASMAARLCFFCTVPCLHFFFKPISRTRSSSHAAVAARKLDKEPYWDSINADITAHLQRRLPTGSPLIVHQPISHLVISAPPTVAPALCIATCELVGGLRSSSLAVACALRLMHVACFIHENLQKPNGLATPSFPANIELLSGDAILPLGYELAAGSIEEGNDPKHVLRVIAEIARAMGAEGAADGRRLLHERWNSGWIAAPAVLDVCKKNEGRFFACGAACGAILGGVSEERIEKLRRFGFFLGTVHGVLLSTERSERGNHEHGLHLDELLETAQGFRSLALMELKGLDAAADVVSALVEMCCSLW